MCEFCEAEPEDDDDPQTAQYKGKMTENMVLSIALGIGLYQNPVAKPAIANIQKLLAKVMSPEMAANMDPEVLAILIFAIGFGLDGFPGVDEEKKKEIMKNAKAVFKDNIVPGPTLLAGEAKSGPVAVPDLPAKKRSEMTEEEFLRDLGIGDKKEDEKKAS